MTITCIVIVAGGVMELEIEGSAEGRYGSLPNCGAADVQVIVKAAQKELRNLMQQRAEIMKRIVTIKQTHRGAVQFVWGR